MKNKCCNFIYLTIGSIILAIGIYFFRIPNNFIVGGEKNFIIAVLKPQQASLLKKNIKIIDRNAFAVGMTTFDITGGWLAGKNKVV